MDLSFSERLARNSCPSPSEKPMNTKLTTVLLLAIILCASSTTNLANAQPPVADGHDMLPEPRVSASDFRKTMKPYQGTAEVAMRRLESAAKDAEHKSGLLGILMEPVYRFVEYNPEREPNNSMMAAAARGASNSMAACLEYSLSHADYHSSMDKLDNAAKNYDQRHRAEKDSPEAKQRGQDIEYLKSWAKGLQSKEPAKTMAACDKALAYHNTIQGLTKKWRSRQ